MPDSLESQLRGLGRALQTAPPAGLEARVLARVRTEPTPQRRSPAAIWLRTKGRWVAAVAGGLLTVGVVASPVGAQVREWFGFHGVVVDKRAPRVTGPPTVPPATGTLPAEDAGRHSGFTPLIPAALGPPDALEESPDRAVVSMSWRTPDGTLRLDQFDGEIEPRFWKASLDAELVHVNGGDALWFPTSHEVVVLKEGRTRRYPPRLAAATLIWPRDDITLRLEGVLTLDQAVRIAATAR